MNSKDIKMIEETVNYLTEDVKLEEWIIPAIVSHTKYILIDLKQNWHLDVRDIRKIVIRMEKNGGAL